MNNSDMPAMPVGLDNYVAEGFDAFGLTKREQFCLHAGVPETGDPMLDDIIRKGERKRIAAMAIESMLSSKFVNDFFNETNDSSYDMPHGLANNAIRYADVLLKELEK